jgi:D-sedoheptulose 7-phosphate isomerase
MIDISTVLRDHQAVIKNLITVRAQIELVGQCMTTCLDKDGKILWMGNGGSAADCQHFAAEIVGRFARQRRGFPSIALTTDSSILTSIGNDFSFDTIFARQIEAHCRPDDVVVGISTSGNSRNVLCGMERAKEAGAFVVALTGDDGGAIKALADVSVVVPSRVVPRIQEAHVLIGHIWCELIDEFLAERERLNEEAAPERAQIAKYVSII